MMDMLIRNDVIGVRGGLGSRDDVTPLGLSAAILVSGLGLISIRIWAQRANQSASWVQN